MNFWDQTHPLSADNERLFEQLVPGSGNCATLQGECLRAASKIGYDWYNNGWGCNNWSGAVVFLREHAMILAAKRTEQERAEFLKALRFCDNFSHGERVTCSDEDADKEVTVIAAFVTQCCLDNPEPIVNTLDMLDFREPDAPYEEEDDGWYGDDE